MERFRKAYEIMELSPDASLEQVKKSFRRLALRYHPDLNSKPGAGEKFILIKKAYDIILTADRTFNQEPILHKKERRSRDRDKEKISKQQAMSRAREKIKRYEEMRVQLDAKHFARFKRTIYYPWTMSMSYFSLIFIILMLIDAFTVNIVHSGFVVSKTPVTIEAFGVEVITGYSIDFKDGSSVILGSRPANNISVASYVSLAETMIFRDVPEIHVVNRNFKEFSMSGFNKPPYLFFILFIMVPVLILFVDRPSAVFYSAGAFARYGVIIFIASFLIF
ncbi:J domain-containing protein [Salibacteraceae bacterium]|nr:J domain-containing protein [Salibacteraceae bacterium]